MKITLTTAEANKILVAYYANSLNIAQSTVDVEIIPDGNIIVKEIEAAVNGAGPDNGQYKIARIKALRTITNKYAITPNDLMGLADAKYAIENWQKYLSYILLHGKLPANGFAYTGISN
jgi:hypothetical protein